MALSHGLGFFLYYGRAFFALREPKVGVGLGWFEAFGQRPCPIHHIGFTALPRP